MYVSLHIQYYPGIFSLNLVFNMTNSSQIVSHIPHLTDISVRRYDNWLHSVLGQNVNFIRRYEFDV